MKTHQPLNIKDMNHHDNLIKYLEFSMTGEDKAKNKWFSNVLQLEYFIHSVDKLDCEYDIKIQFVEDFFEEMEMEISDRTIKQIFTDTRKDTNLQMNPIAQLLI